MDSIKLKTPMQLWDKYDPKSSDLEVSIIDRKITDTVEETLYAFTPIVAEDGRVRVTMSVKKQVGLTSAPVVLYIPSNYESDPCSSLLQLVENGIAVATINYSGESGNTTPPPRYPKSLSYGYYSKSQGRLMDATCAAEQTSVYLWCKIMRRAITLLEFIPQLDATNICAMAWRDGANILWQLAGVDHRLKSIVPILNSGYGEYAGYYKYSDTPEPEFTAERTRSIIGLAAQSYAKSILCNVYIVSASNDRHYAYDRVSDIVELLPDAVETRQLVACGLDGQIYSDSVTSIVKYITSSLRGERALAHEPKMSLELVSGKVHVAVTVDHQYDSIETLELCYSSGEVQGEYRNWIVNNLGVDMEGKANSAIKVYDVSERLYVYATVKYKSGMSLSSSLITIIPDTLGEITPSIKGTRIIYERKMGISSFFPRSNRHVVASQGVVPAVGPLEIMGVSAVEKMIVNYNIGSSKCDDEDSLLQIDIYSASETTVILAIIDDTGHEFYSEIMLKGEAEWTRMQLSCSELKDSNMVALKGWSHTKVLKIYNANKLIINNILWV